MGEKIEIKVGMMLAEEYAVGWGRNYRFRIHEVVRVTPSGRFKTDLGIECNPDCTKRGSGGYRKLMPITTEIREKIERDQVVDKLKRALNDLNDKSRKIEALDIEDARFLLEAVTTFLDKE